MNEKNLNEALVSVQSKLKAPKSQYNSFGKYKYRSCEDILEAVKPLLAEVGCSLTISDEIMQVGERIYVKATATLSNGADVISVSAFARETETKTGMDAAQITGAASSYARKYALNGLFCIDDTNDPDATNTHGKDTAPKDNISDAMSAVALCKTVKELCATYKKFPAFADNADFIAACAAKRKEIQG